MGPQRRSGRQRHFEAKMGSRKDRQKASCDRTDFYRSRLGVWGGKDILMQRQGVGENKWFWGIREKSQETNTRFEVEVGVRGWS